MPTKQEILKKRWLLLVAYTFQAVIPILILAELFIKNKTSSLPAFLVILGILYVSFLSKKVKEKAKEMKEGSAKLFITELNSLVPFAVVALLVYLTEHLFNGFWKWCGVIVACVGIGSIIKLIEYEANKKFIYKCRIYSLAQEQVDIDKAKKELESTLEEL